MYVRLPFIISLFPLSSLLYLTQRRTQTFTKRPFDFVPFLEFIPPPPPYRPTQSFCSSFLHLILSFFTLSLYSYPSRSARIHPYAHSPDLPRSKRSPFAPRFLINSTLPAILLCTSLSLFLSLPERP